MSTRSFVFLSLLFSLFAQAQSFPLPRAPEPQTPGPELPLPRGVKEIAICDRDLDSEQWFVDAPAGVGVNVLDFAVNGNPNAYRSVAIDSVASFNPSRVEPVIHFFKEERLDLDADGSVFAISGSFDLQLFGEATEVALVLLQDATRFIGPRTKVGQGSSGWRTITYRNLSPDDFQSETGATPDLGCGNGPVLVGMLTMLSLPGATPRPVGIDNFCLRVQTRCCAPQPFRVEPPDLPETSRSEPKPEPDREGVLVRDRDLYFPPFQIVPRCCDERAQVDDAGNPIPPPDADPSAEPELSYVDEVVGPVKTLKPDVNTSLDTWYERRDCDTDIGVPELPDDTRPDLEQELKEIGITDVTAEELETYVADFEVKLFDHIKGAEHIGFETYGPIAGPLLPADAPPLSDCPPGAFQGRDIVFVHGFKIDHIIDRLLAQNGAASIKWQAAPLSGPASDTNPQYYEGGYFKQHANLTWNAHIEEFLTNRNYRNRYVTVAYSNADRLEAAALAVLRQISDAMNYGTGVKFTKGSGSTAGFGRRGMVIISHSAGALVTDVAMTAAAQHPGLQVGYIPQYTKAHIAAQGAFSGSRYASGALTAAKIIDGVVPAWVCALARASLQQLMSLTNPLPLPECDVLTTLRESILVDLSPRVTQEKWGSYVRDMPVRTLTLAGAHPTAFGPLKRILHKGFDDGVVTVNSQTANPNSYERWPSGFQPSSLAGLYDIGIFGPNGTLKLLIAQVQSVGLRNPVRATGFWLDQVVDHVLVDSATAGAGPIPWITATGLRQYPSSLYTTSVPTNPATGTTAGYSCLQRSPNHFSYLYSSADHFKGVNDRWDGFNLPNYADTKWPLLTSETNWEETRAITDPAVYVAYGADGVPLLRTENEPTVMQIERGLRVRFRTIKKWKIVWGDWKWIWRRYYYVLAGSKQKMQFDYVYESVLR